jgi:hypothetical protein
MVEPSSASDLEGSVTVDGAKYDDMQRHGGLVERRDREEGERDREEIMFPSKSQPGRVGRHKGFS